MAYRANIVQNMKFETGKHYFLDTFSTKARYAFVDARDHSDSLRRLALHNSRRFGVQRKVKRMFAQFYSGSLN